MSAQTIHDAFQPAEQLYRAAVLRDTWGHLAPDKGRKYLGFVVFACGEFGDIVSLHSDFGTLDSSPWFYDALSDFMAGHALKENTDGGAVFRFDGHFRNYRFVGKVRRLKVWA